MTGVQTCALPISYQVSAEYYSGLGIVIEPVGPDALGAVCQVLADACRDTLEAIPGAAGESVEVRVLLRYREEAWGEGAYCAYRVSLFSAMNFDYEVEMERFVSAEALEESVLAEVRIDVFKSLDHEHQGSDDPHRPGCAGPDLAHEKGVRHIVDRRHQHTDDRGHRQPGDQPVDRRLDHHPVSLVLCHRLFHHISPSFSSSYQKV